VYCPSGLQCFTCAPGYKEDPLYPPIIPTSCVPNCDTCQTWHGNQAICNGGSPNCGGNCDYDAALGKCCPNGQFLENGACTTKDYCGPSYSPWTISVYTDTAPNVCCTFSDGTGRDVAVEFIDIGGSATT